MAEELESQFKKGNFFQTTVLNLETKRLEKRYYKILSIRTDKLNFILGFRVQRCEYKKIKTVVEAIDACKDKKILLKDVYELKATNDDPIYYKYIYLHWLSTFGCNTDRLLEDHELIKTIDRK
jgi:hypothetical protein